MVPTHSTLWEGGDWFPWRGKKKITEKDLEARHCTAVLIHGRQVHSLKFGDGREWDCINGWRIGTPHGK